METILRPPQWPKEFSHFVTWCLMWDPRNRPTSLEAMQHPYFSDAVDPLRPKSSTSRILGKKHMSIDGKSQRDSHDAATASNKPSWFRKSLIRDHNSSAQAAEHPVEPTNLQRPASPRHPLLETKTETAVEPSHSRFRPFGNKRATWTNGTLKSNAAPMPILPSIRPISPFKATVNAEVHNNVPAIDKPLPPNASQADSTPSKKIGRQLSIQSHNHYADRQEAEQALLGQKNPQSPGSEQRGFFAHLRKRARRFSGKPYGPTPGPDESEANIGSSSMHSNRGSMVVDSNMDSIVNKDFSDIDNALQAAAYGAAPLSPALEHSSAQHAVSSASTTNLTPQRQHSLSKSASTSALDVPSPINGIGGPISSRTRRALQKSTHPNQIYDTPDEEDELLQEALFSAQKATKNMERRSRVEDDHLKSSAKFSSTTTQPRQPTGNPPVSLNPYPTPSPSAKRNGMLFDQTIMDQPVTSLNLTEARNKHSASPRFPTPPYEENEWGASAAASIFAAGSIYQ